MLAGNCLAFHHSVIGQNSARASVMGRSRPNFSPKLEPINKTTNCQNISPTGKNTFHLPVFCFYKTAFVSLTV